MSDNSTKRRSSTGGGRRILVVDDDEDDRLAVTDLLELQGYRTDTAVDGKQALNLLRDGPAPAAIVLDLVMPGMDGWEFYERLKERGRARAPPVVVLAAAGDRGPPGGVQGYLTKPVVGELLLRVLAELTADS